MAMLIVCNNKDEYYRRIRWRFLSHDKLAYNLTAMEYNRLYLEFLEGQAGSRIRSQNRLCCMGLVSSDVYTLDSDQTVTKCISCENSRIPDTFNSLCVSTFEALIYRRMAYLQ